MKTYFQISLKVCLSLHYKRTKQHTHWCITDANDMFMEDKDFSTKKFKHMKIYFTILALMINLSSYAYDFKIDGNYYTLLSTSERTVSFSGTDNTGKLQIPSSITIEKRVFTVTKIEGLAFNGVKNVVSVVIPPTITSLSSLSMAFGEFESVQLPSELTEICDQAFFKCSNLKSIEIPDNVTKIGHFAFEECTSLTKIKLPKSLKSIGAGAFVNGAKPKGSLVIPSEMYFNTDYYGNGRNFVAFDDLSKLDSLIFEDSNSSLYASGGKLWEQHDKDSHELAKATNLDYIYIGRFEIYGWGNDVYARKVEYGNKCTTQYNYWHGNKNNCFTDFSSTKLEEIIFGKNITKISSYASSTNLLKVVVKSTTPPTSDGFSNNTYIKGTLYVPKGCIDIYKNASIWKEFWNIEEYHETDNKQKKCDKPSVVYKDGSIFFTSNTPNAQFHYNISSTDIKSGICNEEVKIDAVYVINVYATAAGYLQSDNICAKIYWIDGTIEDTSNILHCEKRAITVNSQHGNITITGLNDNERVSFYSIDGKLLDTQKANGNSMQFSTNTKYLILKIGNSSIKTSTY